MRGRLIELGVLMVGITMLMPLGVRYCEPRLPDYIDDFPGAGQGISAYTPEPTGGEGRPPSCPVAEVESAALGDAILGLGSQARPRPYFSTSPLAAHWTPDLTPVGPVTGKRLPSLTLSSAMLEVPHGCWDGPPCLRESAGGYRVDSLGYHDFWGKLGLRRGDHWRTLNGRPLREIRDLVWVNEPTGPVRSLTLGFRRDGVDYIRTVTVTD